MKGCVYILRDAENRLYIGSTDSISRRLKQHLVGHTQTTARMKNTQLALSQEFESLEIARKIERKIKNLKRKDYIEKMIADGHIKMSL